MRLSELFAEGSDTLLLYSFMYGPTPTRMSAVHVVHRCDRRRARAPDQRIAFAAVARSPIERFRAHARTRGWRRARLLSSSANTFNADYHAEDADGEQNPLAHVFVRHDGVVRHSYTTELLFAPAVDGRRARATSTPCGRCGMSST